MIYIWLKIKIRMEMKQRYILKDTLLNILENIREGYINKNKKIEMNNKERLNNSKLLRYNNINDYQNSIYLYRNKNILNEIYKDKMVSNYIKKIMTQLINSRVINIHYNGPIFYHTINKVYILLFIYRPKNNNMINKIRNINENILIRLVNKLLKNKQGKNNIVSLFSNNLYNKEVIIEPIYLTYDYLDSKILSKTISSNIYKYNQYKGLYSNIISKNIPLMSVKDLTYSKLYNKKLLYKLLTLTDLNNYLLNNNNISKLDTLNYDTKISNSNINSTNCIEQLLLYQYIIGYDWVYSGKLAKSDSNARSIYSLKQYGTLTNRFTKNNGLLTTSKTIYSLNKNPSYITKNSNNLINKNGKYNISVTLSHI